MLPSEWSAHEIGELFQFKSGGTPAKTNDQYWNGEHPWVSARDMKSTMLGETELTLTNEGLKKSKQVPEGTILILVRGMTLFKRVPVLLTNRPASFNQDIKALIPTKRIETRFALQSLLAAESKIRQIVDSAGHGTGRLDTTRFSQLPLLVPPSGEQRRISQVLDLWDQAIAICTNLLELSRQQKKALAQKLLTGKRRLPGFRREWEKVHLEEVFTERTETNRLELPLLSITSDRGVIPQSEVGRKDSSTEDKSKYKRIAPGDIGYNSMRMWQGVSALSELEGIVSPAYTIVTPRGCIDAKFMSYLFKMPRTVHDFRRYSQGLTSDTWNLKFKQFREVSVRIPEFEEQQAIAKVFTLQDEVIAKLKTNKEKLELEKRALMQQLLTGKRRVKLPPEHNTLAKEPAS